MKSSPELSRPSPETASTDALLAVVRELFAEVNRQGGQEAHISLDSQLDADLGFDSLTRMELLLRIQRSFGVDLPEGALGKISTPRDLLDALRQASPALRTTLRRIPIPNTEIDEAILASTLVEVLDWHAQRNPDRIPITYLSETGEQPITCRDLARASERMAAGLQRCGLEAGQTVAIMLPTCSEYFAVYFGILRAGGIPVPIYPPAHQSQVEDHVRRHVGILQNAQTVLLVTAAEMRLVSQLLRAQVACLRAIVSAEELRQAPGSFTAIPVCATDVAFIQYTSGSTGDPKGVVLTHANLLANIRAMGKAIHIRADDVFVSWLPLYHDMGLIGAWLGTMYFGIPLVIMSPLSFITRPARWLQAIHTYRGTISAAPNFAYELCVKKIGDEELIGLDLSSWRLAFNGAEAVLPETLKRFGERFSRYGLHVEALTPVYGLAECSVGLAFPPLERGPLVDLIDRELFTRTGRAQPSSHANHAALSFVSSGRPLPGHELRIVDATGVEIDQRQEGHVEFRGPSTTCGYFNNPQATAKLFHGDWLNSGDCGYMADGEIFLTGRTKDIIIRGGRNIYPHELEEAVSEIPGIRKGCVAVFGSPDPGSGTERLVILAETRQTETTARQRLYETIRSVVLETLGEPADEIMLVPPHTVLKTSSGKLRRAATRALFEAGLTNHKSAKWHIFRLISVALLAQLRQWAGRGSEKLFSAWSWLIFCLLAPPVWLATVLAPQPSRAWSISRFGARLLGFLTATPVTVSGLENLPSDNPFVLVANHASYLDGIALVATLPTSAVFVAKRELRDNTLTRIYLQHLGVEFVERFTAQESVQDISAFEATLHSGRALIFFPEGTFTRQPGLKPFRLGAFITACSTRMPVIPVAIAGTRSILRDGQWMPRRGAITVTIGPPLFPPHTATHDVFSTAVQLRDAARAFIASKCREPEFR